jgi:hypothetical protein
MGVAGIVKSDPLQMLASFGKLEWIGELGVLGRLERSRTGAAACYFADPRLE